MTLTVSHFSGLQSESEANPSVYQVTATGRANNHLHPQLFKFYMVLDYVRNPKYLEKRHRLE